MTLTISLSPELEQALREQAAQSGQDMVSFVLEAVREKITRARTFEEIGAPLARAVEATRMTDEEFNRFFEEARDEVWREKQGGPP